MSRYFKRYSVLAPRGLGSSGSGGDDEGGGSATTVALHTVRNDGLTGPARAVGGVTLAPNTVYAADIANAYVVDANGDEVACYVEDVGSRHIGEGDGTSLLTLYVEFQTTHADTNDLPQYTLKFDRAPTVAPLTKAGVTHLANELVIGLSADKKQLRITQPFSYYYFDENTVRRAAAGNCAWDLQFDPGAVTPSGAAYGYYRLAICANAAGQLFAKDIQGFTLTSAVSSPWYIPNPTFNIPDDYQVLGIVAVFVPEGVTFTPGTDLLDANGVVAGITGSAAVPVNELPYDIPPVIVAPRATAHLQACKFNGYALASLADWTAMGTPYDQYPNYLQNYSDQPWRRSGYNGANDVFGWTIYAQSLMQWQMYALTGEVRYLRRALVYGPSIARALTVEQAVPWQPNEPGGDLVTHLAYYLLTGDGTHLNDVAHLATVMESTFLGISGGDGVPRRHSGTGRRGKHIIFGMPWAVRAGVNLTAREAAYVLNATDKANSLWPDAESWTTVTTDQQRWERMVSKMLPFMADAPYAGAGMRYFNLDGYDTAPNGVSGAKYTDTTKMLGPFMQGFTFSEMVLGCKMFGTPAGVLAMLRDGTDYLFAGVSPVDQTTPLYSTTEGKQSFTYWVPNFSNSSEPISVAGYASDAQRPIDPLLDPVHQTVIAFLLETDGDTKWRDRGDAMLRVSLVMNAHAEWPYQFSKTTSEIGLHAMSWPLQREVIP